MDIRKISGVIAKLGIRIPETPLKEEVVRFLTETKSERVVEVPLILSSIPKDKPLKILDIGCRYSILAIQLASIGHKVDGIDINSYHLKHPNFNFKKQDIIKSGFKDNTFDIIISLSTLEHIGLGRYGDQLDHGADTKVVKEVSRILSSDGRFLLTVPFGIKGVTPWYRVYDFPSIEKLLKDNGLKVDEIRFYKEQNKGCWMPTTQDEASRIDSSSYAKAVAFIDATKTTKLL